jgi:hypothetical protein
MNMIIPVDKAGLRVSELKRNFLALLSFVNHYCNSPEEKKKGLSWRNLMAPNKPPQLFTEKHCRTAGVRIDTYYCRCTRKNLNSRWISKKLHIGGVQFFYYFGVHTVRRNDTKNCYNEQDEAFLRRHHCCFSSRTE